MSRAKDSTARFHFMTGQVSERLQLWVGINLIFCENHRELEARRVKVTG